MDSREGFKHYVLSGDKVLRVLSNIGFLSGHLDSGEGFKQYVLSGAVVRVLSNMRFR